MSKKSETVEPVVQDAEPAIETQSKDQLAAAAIEALAQQEDH